ncbi:MAG: alpha/beta fold hydrolase [Candidatus Peribacteria bacterium]|nr:MAG: alpha/beta fold hydrolase [Candidatus Peribacteria bacterium]
MNFSNLSNTAFIDRKYRYSIYFVVLLVMVYLLLLIFAKRIETSVSFPAVHYNVQELSGYISKNITFEEINVTSEDGDTINGLYAEGRIPNKIVYYFHGNGGSLEYFYSEIAYILSLGYTVIAFDYPGYGKSSGYPYEQKVYTYARDFFAYLQDQKGIREEDTVIW